jgi:S1-C subfamily serine protease
MGSPIFRHHLLLKGSIARRSETFSWYDGSFKNTFPITGIAAPGSSGGPWVNAKGEIIAIQVAGVTTDFGHQGVNSAVGGISLKSFLENKETVTVPTIQSAVEELWGQSPLLISDMPKEVKGLLFRQVSPHGVCAKAGIKDENIMLQADNKTYQRIEPFIKYIRSLSIGSEIKFSICNFEGENIRTIAINLAELK